MNETAKNLCQKGSDNSYMPIDTALLKSLVKHGMKDIYGTYIKYGSRDKSKLFRLKDGAPYIGIYKNLLANASVNYTDSLNGNSYSQGTNYFYTVDVDAGQAQENLLSPKVEAHSSYIPYKVRLCVSSEVMIRGLLPTANGSSTICVMPGWKTGAGSTG